MIANRVPPVAQGRHKGFYSILGSPVCTPCLSGHDNIYCGVSELVGTVQYAVGSCSLMEDVKWRRGITPSGRWCPQAPKRDVVRTLGVTCMKREWDVVRKLGLIYIKRAGY